MTRYSCILDWPNQLLTSLCIFMVDGIISCPYYNTVFSIRQKGRGGRENGGWSGESIPIGMVTLKMAVVVFLVVMSHI